jgi:phosphatidylserine/phosphatidylglycerophosphate/cardiolipin synthase-like enzyme
MQSVQLTDLDQYKRPQPWLPDAEYPSMMRTFYSPIDDVHGVLKEIIGSCRRSLVAAVYGYDDDELAAMIDGLLKNPAIYVQITLDRSQAGGVHEKALLAKYAHEMTGNSVAIGSSEKGAIMHRKMLLVDGIWRVTGSTNWSTSGETLQDNELTVTQSASVVAEARTVLDIEHDAALSQQAKRAAVLAKAAA